MSLLLLIYKYFLINKKTFCHFSVHSASFTYLWLMSKVLIHKPHPVTCRHSNRLGLICKAVVINDIKGSPRLNTSVGPELGTPFGQYQITLFGNRGTCVRTICQGSLHEGETDDTSHLKNCVIYYNYRIASPSRGPCGRVDPGSGPTHTAVGGNSHWCLYSTSDCSICNTNAKHLHKIHLQSYHKVTVTLKLTTRINQNMGVRKPCLT